MTLEQLPQLRKEIKAPAVKRVWRGWRNDIRKGLMLTGSCKQGLRSSAGRGAGKC